MSQHVTNWIGFGFESFKCHGWGFNQHGEITRSCDWLRFNILGGVLKTIGRNRQLVLLLSLLLLVWCFVFFFVLPARSGLVCSYISGCRKLWVSDATQSKCKSRRSLTQFHILKDSLFDADCPSRRIVGAVMLQGWTNTSRRNERTSKSLKRLLVEHIWIQIYDFPPFKSEETGPTFGNLFRRTNSSQHFRGLPTDA